MLFTKYPLALKEYCRDRRQLNLVATMIILFCWFGILVYQVLTKQNDPLWQGLSDVMLVSSVLSSILLWQNHLMMVRRLKDHRPELCLVETKCRLVQLAAHRQRLYFGLFIVILIFLVTATSQSMYLCGMMAAAVLFTALVFSFILIEQWVTTAFYDRVTDRGFNASE